MPYAAKPWKSLCTTLHKHADIDIILQEITSTPDRNLARYARHCVLERSFKKKAPFGLPKMHISEVVLEGVTHTYNTK